MPKPFEKPAYPLFLKPIYFVCCTDLAMSGHGYAPEGKTYVCYPVYPNTPDKTVGKLIEYLNTRPELTRIRVQKNLPRKQGGKHYVCRYAIPEHLYWE